jgi:hypothetical protein
MEKKIVDIKNSNDEKSFKNEEKSKSLDEEK